MWKSAVERNCWIREIAAGLLQYDNVYATEATIRIKIHELENGLKKALDAYNLIQPFSTDPYQLNKLAEDRFKHFLIKTDNRVVLLVFRTFISHGDSIVQFACG